jgi:plastocyanin
MRPGLVLRAGAVFASLVLTLGPAHAGQVRISLTGGNSFSPTAISLNQGDHVVWVWLGGAHTVTSGTDGSSTGDGLFDSHASSFGGTNARFAWKSTVTGARGFYCEPHFPFMLGTLNIAASGVAVSDFRLSEIQSEVAGNLDLLEIRNAGGAAGNLGRYRLAITGQATAELPVNDIVVPVNGHVVVHVNTSGTNTATDVFLPTVTGLPSSGSIALYAPNTQNANLADPSQIIDYVEWGAGGQANEATAGSAALWVAGEFVPAAGDPAHSLEFCGTAAQRGASFWAEVAVPNFGTNDMCATPAVPTTWGRIKAIYR